MRISGHWFTALAVIVLGLSGEPVCPGNSDATEQLTPLLLAVHDAPVPFQGSDDRTHLVYELWITNFSSAEVALKSVEVLGDGVVLQQLDAGSIAMRLQPVGLREPVAAMARNTQALLFLDVVLEQGKAAPKQLSHRVTAHVDAAPPDRKEMTENGGTIDVDQRKPVIIGPPLSGERFISADSCCGSSRHRRAALPVNGRAWLAQRFAVDWEQLNADGRIYSGPSNDLKSYSIFGQPVLAVADARVQSVTEGQPEQTPQKYPANIVLDEADGNSVVLDLGEQHYALYAHMQPGSIRVHSGDKVKRGQVIGLVGNTGNSVAPHLHFQVMDGPLSLASNGLPYEIDEFQISGKTPGTEAFDEAEGKGVPLQVAPISMTVKNGLPLDQLRVTFSSDIGAFSSSK